jgi:CHRD domain
MKVRLSYVAAVVAVVASLGAAAAVVLGADPAARDLKFGGMLGANEIGPSGPGAGDPDGRGSASITLVDPDTVCFGLTADNIAAPVAAHIHRGPKGVNGPVVVTLTPPATGDPGASSGCVGGVAPELIAEIRHHPKAFYFNVHTADFPGGAIRGQVFSLPKKP